MNKWIVPILAILCLISSKNISAYDYDLIVIGGGDVGAQAALLASSKNKRVAIVHTNEACVESAHLGNVRYKILIETASLINTISRCQKAGLPVICPTIIDLNNIMEYIEKMYQNVCSMYSLEALARHNIATFTGAVSFIDEHTLNVRGNTISSEYILLALEGYTEAPDIKGINSVQFSTPENFFENKLPKSITILAEDPIGIELAFALNILGIDVHLIEWYGVLMPHIDYEINNILYQIMQKNGINIYLGAKNISVHSKNDTSHITINFKDRYNQKQIVKSECLFIAAPPTYDPKKLALDKVHVKTDKKRILIDTSMKTSNNAIYACGNITYQTKYRCPYSLSLYQAQVAIHNMFKSFWSSTMHADYTNAEEVVQTTPPLAFAGLTEQEAYKKYGKSIQIKYYPYHHLVRAHIDNATEGIAKFICDKKGNIVGIHILGNDAQELVALIPLGANLKDLYASYLETASSSPSYLDLLWQASYLE